MERKEAVKEKYHVSETGKEYDPHYPGDRIFRRIQQEYLANSSHPRVGHGKRHGRLIEFGKEFSKFDLRTFSSGVGRTTGGLILREKFFDGENFGA